MPTDSPANHRKGKKDPRDQTKAHASLSALSTEQVNSRAAGLDLKSSLDIANTINAEDFRVLAAVKRALPQVARAINVIADALKRGGRLIYVGAGTSGRIAALDAAECVPTFGLSRGTVQFVMAGGPGALANAVEGEEDSTALGEHELAKIKPGKKDVVVGLAASGRTPFTIAAVAYARRHGAKTIAVTCNRHSPLEKAAHFAIVAEVGPEVVSGSTRMKAGTAQKMILNMLSTGAMTRLGYVYGNLMVNVRPNNEKLVARGVSVLQRAAKVDRSTAQETLRKAGNSVPVAVVMLQAGATRAGAERALKAEQGHVRKAIARAKRARRQP